jgi:hypothetical protein
VGQTECLSPRGHEESACAHELSNPSRYDAKPDRKRESGAEQRKCRITNSAGSLVARPRKCSRGGGHKENEHQVRHHASDATPGGIPKVPRRTNMAFGSSWGTGRQKAERMALVAKDFQTQRRATDFGPCGGKATALRLLADADTTRPRAESDTNHAYMLLLRIKPCKCLSKRTALRHLHSGSVNCSIDQL